MKKLILTLWVMLLVLGIVSSVNAYPVDGLVASYRFDGNANDSSGNDNNGLVYGADLTTDRFGNPNSAYHFDGVNDFIRIEDSTTNSSFDEITMAVWVNIESHTSPMGGIVTRWNQNHDVGDYYGIWYDNYWSPETIRVASHEYYMANMGMRSDIVNLNEWYFIVFSISPIIGNELFYINGELFDTRDRTELIRDSDLPIIIGADIHTYQSNNCYRFFRGAIDDVLIYDRVLSDNEILTLYNEPTPIPDASTILLLSSSLIPIAGFRRKFRK